MGMGKVMLEQSDKMWDRAQKIMHFMLHRHSIYIRTVGKLLVLVDYFADLV